MIQCSTCEHFERRPEGGATFHCDPYSTIKEPECLVKLQLARSAELGVKMDRMVRAYEATLEIYRRLGPMQEKLFRHMEREIDEVEEADSWKFQEDEEDEDQQP